MLFSPLGAVIATTMIGRFIGRHGSKNLVLVMAPFIGVSVPLALLAPNVWLFRSALFLFGVANSSQDVSMNAQAVLIQHRFEKPIMSFTHGCWSLGGFLAGMGVAAASRFGVSPAGHTLVVDCLIVGLILAIGRFLLPHLPEDVVTEPAFVIPKGLLLILGLLTMCAFAAEGAAFDWVAVFFRTVRASSESTAAFAFAVFGVSMASSRLFGDLVVHRLGNRKALVFGGAVGAVGILVAVWAPTDAVSALGFVLCGLGLANLVPILFRAGGSVEGVPSGIGVAAVSSCGYVAFLLSPPIIGLVADRVSLPFALSIVALTVLFVPIFGPRCLARTNMPL